MWPKCSLAAAIVLFFSIHAAAQGVTAVIDRDIRVFTVVAALNAAGFDIELAPQYHPVRQELRRHLQGLDPNIRQRLVEFYEEHKAGESDEDQLAKYISLALNLTDPPQFEFAYGFDFVPPDVRSLERFLPLLREFFVAAQITQVWSALAPSYEEDLGRLSAPLRDMVLRSDAYLRVPPGGSDARQLVIFQELAAPINSVHVRNYSDNLYIVMGHSPSVPVDDVRHAYLHLLLDPIVAASRAQLEELQEIRALIDGVEGVRSQYAQNFEILVGESLIRAAEMRMDGIADDAAREPLDRAYRSGLLLAPRFFELLPDFEDSDAGMRAYFPTMMADVSLMFERARFEDRFHSIPAVAEAPSPAEVPAPPDPIPPLLETAQAAFNAGDDQTAEAAFERILAEFDPENGPALYGLGLIASRREDPAAARDYFERAIASGSAEPAMVVWSHIYLGRIFDIECSRNEALSHYRAAIETGDDTRNAQAAAESGVAEPFGGACF